MKKNPLYFLRKYLPSVSRGEKIIIMSVLNRVNKPVRIMYYMSFTDHIDGQYIPNGVALMRQNFSIPELNSKNDPVLNKVSLDKQKYSLITNAGYISRLVPYYKTTLTMSSIKKIIKNFDYEDPNNPLYNNPKYPYNYLYIDTICITDSVGKNPEIVYDLSGHIDLGKEYKQKSQYWSEQRKLAERIYEPTFLQERGYFDPNGNVDLVYPDSETERINRLREEPDPYYEGSLFDFGPRRKIRLRKIKNK